MPRPELLARTYESFKRNLLGLEVGTVWLNIDSFPDMLPSDRATRITSCIDIARCVWARPVVVNPTQKPSFPAAVRWCWQQAATPLILNLEDDWELLDRIAVDDLLAVLQARPASHQVVLRPYAKPESQPFFMLAPSLIRREMYQAAAARMPGNLNPEVWIRRQGCWNTAAFYPCTPVDKIVVRDLGRQWLEASPWARCAATEPQFCTYSARTSITARHSRRLAQQARQAEASAVKYGLELPAQAAATEPTQQGPDEEPPAAAAEEKWAPRIVHQIWLGAKPPLPWLDQVRRAYEAAGWSYRLWTDRNRPTLRNEAQFRAIRELCGKADILRYELLLDQGGLYVDADCEPISLAPDTLLRPRGWAAYESEQARPGLVGNSVLASPAGGELMGAMVAAIAAIEPARINSLPAWQQTGPRLLTERIAAMRQPQRPAVAPSWLIYPQHHSGLNQLPAGCVPYFRHHWVSTKTKA
jgi:mannosyltransferase OCH1-like enzyme